MTAIQAFGEQAQAVPVCPQHLDHVAATPGEDEQMPAERVILQRVLYPGRQAGKAVAHVRHAGNQPDAGTRNE